MEKNIIIIVITIAVFIILSILILFGFVCTKIFNKNDILFSNDTFEYITSVNAGSDVYSLYYKTTGFQDKVIFISLYKGIKTDYPLEKDIIQSEYFDGSEDVIHKKVNKYVNNEEENIITVILDNNEEIVFKY